MDQSLAIGLLILLALVTANLPFVSERHFLLLPWYIPGKERGGSVAVNWVISVLYAAVLVGFGFIIDWLVGGLLFVGLGVAGGGALLLSLSLVGLLAVLIFWVPGVCVVKGDAAHKPFVVRLAELLVFYALVGVLGFAIESSLGNPFAKTWEFYAITLCLFLVLAYPGFVYRYMMRRRKPSTSPV